MLGTRIKELRDKKGLTQAQLGELLGVVKTTISQYESGDRTPDAAKLEKLADIFDTSVDYLLGREDKSANVPEKDLPQTVAPYLPEGFSELSDEAKKEVLDYIDYIMVKYAKKENK